MAAAPDTGVRMLTVLPTSDMDSRVTRADSSPKQQALIYGGASGIATGGFVFGLLVAFLAYRLKKQTGTGKEVGGQNVAAVDTATPGVPTPLLI